MICSNFIISESVSHLFGNVETFSHLSLTAMGGGASDAYTGYKQSILKDFRFVQLGETTLDGAAKLAMEALK